MKSKTIFKGVSVNCCPRLIAGCAFALVCAAIMSAQTGHVRGIDFSRAKTSEGTFYQCKDNHKSFAASATSALPVDEKVFAGDAVTHRARIESKPQAIYTQKARRHDVSGTVRLKLVLTSLGKVADIKVLKGLPDGLTESTISAACGLKFMPATKDDRAVSQHQVIEYDFILK